MEAERQKLVIDGSSVEPALFSFGPAHSAWINGRLGAIYSVFFALPWILLSLRDLLKRAADQPYLLLGFLASGLMIAARWTLYGFFFGYFYAYIRGRNGFEKALAFWFALVLPSVLASLLSSPLSRASLAPPAVRTAQVFLHCVLLGLFAGELQSLWKAGLSWRHCLEFTTLRRSPRGVFRFDCTRCGRDHGALDGPVLPDCRGSEIRRRPAAATPGR